MHIIVAHNVIYHRASREADMTSASYSKKNYTTRGTSTAARHGSMGVGGVWCVAYNTSVSLFTSGSRYITIQ